MKKTVKLCSMVLISALIGTTVLGCASDNGSATTTPTTTTKEATEKVDDKDVDTTESKEEGASSEAKNDGEIAGGENVKLRIAWNAGGDRSALLEVFTNEYEEKYPNVDFTIETGESGKYQQKIAMDVAAGNTPDIFTYWRPEAAYGVDKYLEAGALADLTEFFEDPYFKDRYPQYAVDTCTVDGKVVAIPAEYAFILFYANKDILDDCGLEAPVTYDEFVNVINVVKENGYIPWAVSTKAFASGWERPLGYSFNRYLSNKGENGTLNAFAGEAPFDSEAAIAAGEAMYELCAGNAAPDAMTLDDAQVTSKYFNTGKALFFINGTYNFLAISEELRANDKLVALSWPDMPGAEYNGPMQDKDLVSVWYCATDSWADPVKQEVLKDFLLTVTNEEAADRLMYEGSSFVPDVNFELDPARTDAPMIEAKAIADVAEQVKWPLSYANPENKEPFYSVYTDFWSGKYTGEEFALKLHDIFYSK